VGSLFIPEFLICFIRFLLLSQFSIFISSFVYSCAMSANFELGEIQSRSVHSVGRGLPDPNLLVMMCGGLCATEREKTKKRSNDYSLIHRRNHHIIMKNQKTMIRKTKYHSQRHPCRAAMLFIRRKVPESIPPVSANASFYGLKKCLTPEFRPTSRLKHTI